jgi:hypothetical protein
MSSALLLVLPNVAAREGGPIGIQVGEEGVEDLDVFLCSGEVLHQVASGICLTFQFHVVLFYICLLG